MLNIIADSCIGADIYKYHLKQPYQNPFCWSTMSSDSMAYLIQNYNNINFNNYKLTKDKNWNFSIIIDNKIKVNYVHYCFSKNDKKIRIDIADVYYNKIWEYIIEKYEERKNRLLKNNEEPIFIFGSTWKYCNESIIEKIIKIKTNYKIIFVINFNCNIKIPNNCILYKSDIYRNNPKLAGELLNNIIYNINK